MLRSVVILPVTCTVMAVVVASSAPAQVAPVRITVAAPAGPAPLGAPVETSVPFAAGELPEPEGLAVLAPSGQPALAQTRPALRWPDGSVRWLHLCFEPSEGPGEYTLAPGAGPAADPILRAEGQLLVLDTGALTLRLPASGPGWMGSLFAAGPEGELPGVLLEGEGACDLVATRHDGTVFRSSLAGETHRAIIEETGPVRASVRFEGKLRSAAGEEHFDYIVRLQAWRGRPELTLSITWLNLTPNLAELVRDLRLDLSLSFVADRVVIGCERGVYDGPFLADTPIYVVQEDSDQYWARTILPDGRDRDLSSGGANGKRAPGWLYLQGQERCLAVYVPGFWCEYPNELRVDSGRLSVGLWPERAAAHLASKRILPREQVVGQPYVRAQYAPIIPMPYLAFFDPETRCLDVPAGTAKTQEIVLSVWGGAGERPSFEPKWWAGSLRPVRGFVDPAQVARSSVCGPLWPRDPERFPEAERCFEEAFGWFWRHPQVLDAYGKFDWGDFHYFVGATDYMTHPGTKWGELGGMPREGYWHNNERDPLRGVLLHYLRTGDPRAWELAQAMARHLLDVDLAHGRATGYTAPVWGIHTHSYGHSYLRTAAGAPDHAWLLGLLEWAGVSGDPVALDWTIKCGEWLAGLKSDFSKTDLRTTSMQLAMMSQFYLYTGDRKYLDAARGPAQALVAAQGEDGLWPPYLDRPELAHTGGFQEHAMMAFGDWVRASGENLDTLVRALDWEFPEVEGATQPRGSVSELGLAMWALAAAGERTGDPRWAEWARRCFAHLEAT